MVILGYTIQIPYATFLIYFYIIVLYIQYKAIRKIFLSNHACWTPFLLSIFSHLIIVWVFLFVCVDDTVF